MVIIKSAGNNRPVTNKNLSVCSGTEELASRPRFYKFKICLQNMVYSGRRPLKGVSTIIGCLEGHLLHVGVLAHQLLYDKLNHGVCKSFFKESKISATGR